MYLANLRLPLRLQNKQIGLFHRKSAQCFRLYSLCSALGVLACQSSLSHCYKAQRTPKQLTPTPHHHLQSQAIPEHLLGGSLKTQPPDACEASLWEILEFWFVQGEHEVSTSPWRALERIVNSTYTWI